MAHYGPRRYNEETPRHTGQLRMYRETGARMRLLVDLDIGESPDRRSFRRAPGRIDAERPGLFEQQAGSYAATVIDPLQPDSTQIN
jgi:hypothetical protein